MHLHDGIGLFCAQSSKITNLGIMVSLRFLRKLCASGIDESSNGQLVYQLPPERAREALERKLDAQDLAMSALHRSLSGLTGTSFQRLEGLLDAVRSPEVTGATFVAFYAVPDGEYAGGDIPLILLRSARCLLEDTKTDDGESHLPDAQQATLFKQMIQDKAPIHAVLDRYPDASTSTAPAASQQSGLHPLSSAARAGASLPRQPSRMLVAAVPLNRGSKIAGALWLEQSTAIEGGGDNSGGERQGSGAPAPGRQSAASGPLPTPSLLSDHRVLRSLGFACSMCMLGSEGSNAAWLAAAVARLGSSDSMSALTANLCAAIAAHIKRQFVLDATVAVALVPPGPDVPLALLLQPSGSVTAAATSNGNMSTLGVNSSYNTTQNGAQVGAGVDLARSGEGLADRLPCSSGAAGAKLSCRSHATGGGRSSSVNVALFAQQQLGITQSLGQSPQDLSGQSATASKRRLRLGPTPSPGLLRDAAALIHARLSLDLNPHTRVAGSVDIIRSPSVGSTASIRPVVVPLTAPHMNNVHAADSSSPYAAMAATAAAISPCTTTLHAKAFPLQRTLLQAHLQLHHRQGRQRQGQQPQVLCPRALASAPQATVAGNSAGEQAGMAAAISAPAATAVVEDTQLHVQNVHKPAGDVCMLMGLTRKTANGFLGGGGGGGGGGFRASVLGPQWASASGMVTGGPLTASGAVAATSAVAALSSVPQSLVLVVASMGEEGAALGLYLCFSKRLPGPLLEAVRASCQELMDKALAPVTRAKLKDAAIAPEYETLCSASPGSYAIVRSQSFCGSQVPAALSAAYMSAVTGSDLGPATGFAETAAVLGATPPELLSGELSTADMDVLLALHAQAQAQAQASGGQHMQTPDVPNLPMRRGSTNTSRRSGQERQDPRAFAVSSLARRTNGASGGGGGGGGGFTAGIIAAAGRAAQYHVSPRSVRSTGASDRRALACSAAAGSAAVGPAVAAATAAGGADCVEPLNLSQLLHSNANDLLAGSSYQAAATRTGSFRSLGGLENGGGSGGAGNGGGVFTAASIITVSGVDTAATARQQLDLLVSSIHATINTDHAAGGASSSPMDDLDALELNDVLGQGGGGTVFKGRLGTLDVAVKLMELPKIDPSGNAAAAAQRKAMAQAGTAPAAAPAASGGGGGSGDEGVPAVAADKTCLNARREMLRNATELAVQSRVSHPNIVQIYATYNDVIMVSKKGPPGCPGSTYRLYPAVEHHTPDSTGAGEDGYPKDRRHVPCVAAAFELCDCGSLGSALAARTFPKAVYRERERNADGAIMLRPQVMVDMKGVYMTLLDVALALRHLHSLHLVHRDVKPANLLLKSNPRDPRGFTVKVADFGFVLHLSETAEDGSRCAIADQACGTVTHMAPEALLAKAKIDASVDIYAFGILMWEIFSGGVRPYPRLQPDKIPRAVYRGARPTFSNDIPASYRNLALACWNTDPHRRPRASDVVVLLNGLLQELES